MSNNRKLSTLPLADGLTDKDMILVTQGGLSKRSTVGALQEGVLEAVAFQQEATESEAAAGDTSDTVMTARRVRAAAEGAAFVHGREYLGAWLNALIAGSAKLNMVGDSTMLGAFGGSPEEHRPAGVLGDLFTQWNISGVTVTNYGIGGTDTQDWLDSDLAAGIANTPDCLFLNYGLNDVRNGVDLIANYAKGLAVIRETRPVEDLTIIINMPNAVTGAGDLLTSNWLESIRAPLRKICRTFKCVFVDLFKLFEDADAMANIMYESPTEGQYIHPGSALYVMEWSTIGALLVPEAFRRYVPDWVGEDIAAVEDAQALLAPKTAPAFQTSLTVERSGAQLDTSFICDGANVRSFFDTYVGSTAASALNFRKARGSKTNPAIVANGDLLAVLFGTAHTGSAFPTSATCGLLFTVNDTSVTSTSIGTRATIQVSKPGTIARTDTVTMDWTTGLRSLIPVLLLDQASPPPTPSGGFYLYSDGGMPKVKLSDGSVKTITLA